METLNKIVEEMKGNPVAHLWDLYDKYESLSVQSYELFFSNISRTIGIALLYEFLNLCICDDKLQVRWQYCF